MFSFRPKRRPRWPFFLLAVSVSLLSACGAAVQIPSDALKTVVSLDNIDCSDCGDKIVADLRDRPGVYEAQFDRRKAEVQIGTPVVVRLRMSRGRALTDLSRLRFVMTPSEGAITAR